MEKQIIVSIGREYGSGGHEIARRLAEKLNVSFYDRNLLEEVAMEKHVDSNNLAVYDEQPKKSFFSRTVRGHSNNPAEIIAQMQFDLLKQKVEDGKSFVVVGRCTDELFMGMDGYVSIFICGDLETKIQRVMDRRNKLRKDAIKTIERHDKTRREYHDHFCKKNKWGVASSYNLSINSSTLGIDKTIDFLYDYITNYVAK